MIPPAAARVAAPHHTLIISPASKCPAGLLLQFPSGPLVSARLQFRHLSEFRVYDFRCVSKNEMKRRRASWTDGS